MKNVIAFFVSILLASITYSQTVGIGSTSFTPGAMLEIHGSGNTSASQALHVENSSGTDMLTVLNNGNVGVGTATPVTRLDFGNGSANVGQIINIYSSGNIRSGIGMDASTAGMRFFGSSAEASTTAIMAWGTISSTDGSTWAELMRLQKDGNVGIGTSSPVTKVQVDLSSANTYASATGADIGLFIKNTNSTANNLDILSFGDANGFGIAQVGATITDHTNHSGKLFFATKASGSSIAQRVTIDENGNLGIGTTSPLYKLHLYNGDAQIYNTTPILSLSESANGGNEYRATVNNNVLSLGRWNNQNSLNINGSGYVGIGTSSPTGLLEIVGTTAGTSPENYLQITGSTANNSNYPGIRLKGGTLATTYPALVLSNGGLSTLLVSGRDGTSYPIRMGITLASNTAANAAASIHKFDGTTSTDLLYIKADGNVGVGTTSPTALLHVNGSAGNGTGVWSNLSDERLKKNIKPLKDGLSIILKLQGVEFNWKDSLKDKQYGRVKGFIAQDVKKVIPEWVKTQNDGYNYLETIGFNAVIVEAIKEQQAIIVKQNSQIEQLIVKLHEVEKQLFLSKQNTQSSIIR